MGDARPGFGIKVSGSEMAPQAIEIAQNGLADPPPFGKENRSGEFRIMGP
jgi:hypothetical protein